MIANRRQFGPTTAKRLAAPSRWVFIGLAILILGNLYVLFQGDQLGVLSVDIVIGSWVLIATGKDLLRLSPVMMYAFFFTVSIYLGHLLVYLGYVPGVVAVFEPKLWDASLALLAFCLGARVARLDLRSPGRGGLPPEKLMPVALIPYLYAIYGIILATFTVLVWRYGLPSMGDVESRTTYVNEIGYAGLLLSSFFPIISTALIAILVTRRQKVKATLVYLSSASPFLLTGSAGPFVFASLLSLMVILRRKAPQPGEFKGWGIYLKVGVISLAFLMAAMILRTVMYYGSSDKGIGLEFLGQQFVDRVIMAQASAFGVMASSFNSPQIGGIGSYLAGLLPFAPNTTGNLTHDLFNNTRAVLSIHHHGTLPPTLIGELYAMGGPLLMLVGSFLLGIVVRIVDRAIDQRVRTLGGLVIMCYLAIALSRMSILGTTMTVRDFWRVLAVWIALLYIPTLMSRSRSGASGRLGSAAAPRGVALNRAE